jgi:Sigma-70, region 4/TnsA endonuclease N terminal
MMFQTLAVRVDRTSDAPTELLPLLVGAVEEVLPERTARIFALRFGLVDGHGRTLAEVGGGLGVTRERIRQLVEKGISSLRRQASSGGNAACQALVHSAVAALRPDEPGITARCAVVAARELPHLPLYQSCSLLLALAGVAKHRRKHYVQGVLSHVRVQAEEIKSAHALRRREQAFVALVDSAFWPSRSARVDTPILRAARLIDESDEERGGRFASDKMRRWIRYESELERHFLREADALPLVVAYQEQPLAVEYELGGEIRIYYPDVLLRLNDGRVLVVELKPRFQMALHANLAKWRAAIRFCHARGWGFLITDGRRSIRPYLERGIDRGFSERVTAAVRQAGTVDWHTYRRIRDAHGATSEDFIALVLQRRLQWSLAPFRLRL